MTRAHVESVSAQANVADCKRGQVKRSGRSQNRLHTQKALLEYLVLGRVDPQ
jgi:hypothetical protein